MKIINLIVITILFGLFKSSTQRNCVDENVVRRLFPFLIDEVPYDPPNYLHSIYKVIGWYSNIWGSDDKNITIDKMISIFIIREEHILISISNLINSTLSIDEINSYIIYTDY